ncbi:MAG: hypothetical protein ACJ8F3_09325 [Xanthobacteraceae bacterium]
MLKLAAAVLAGATVALAVLNYHDATEIKQSTVAADIGGNQTVVIRQLKSQARFTPSTADESPSPISPASISPSSVELPDSTEAGANFTRPVQTIRFANADPSPGTFSLASATTEPVSEPRSMLKVGGFIAFPGKEASVEPAPLSGAMSLGSPAKRGATAMDEVDDYLWEVYQRVPVKRDGSGDFTWKDPAAAQRMGLSVRDYVILGMDPDFREQLYHAGKTMDAAGLQWSMLSAFRDDYRQRLASGFKARGGNSLHGGSTRTGGYGHGRAIDITGADGQASDVWRWIDAHGGKYGLNRPMPGADPAHIQQKGDWHKIAVALRANRGVTLTADASTPTVKDVTGSVKPSSGRKHRLRFARR